jgi:hypothetical protein
MSHAAQVIQLAVPFTWFGMVVAISFLEAPLKFRAPGISVPLGLGIGRLVFRALNLVEVVLAAGLAATVAVAPVSSPTATLLAGCWAILLVQVTLIRPRLDRRARQILAGTTPPRSRLHLGYIAMDAAKVMLLPVAGALLALEALP